MPKIGVLVVAYNAESTLNSVLHRIPLPIWGKIEEVFVFDDASQDNTHEVGKALLEHETFAGKLRAMSIGFDSPSPSIIDDRSDTTAAMTRINAPRKLVSRMMAMNRSPRRAGSAAPDEEAPER